MLNSNTTVAGLMSLLLAIAAGCAAPSASNRTTATDQNAAQSNQTPAAPTSTAQTSSPAPGAGQRTISAADQQFVDEAAQGGMAEVKLGQLASQKASSATVKQFGQQMVSDHTQANNQLKQLAARKGIALATDIGKENQETMNQLTKLSGAEFDRQYIQHMTDDHTKDVASFQREAQQGQDPDLKAWAAQTLPTLQRHLQQVRSVQENLT
jgi:putative membrane protein